MGHEIKLAVGKAGFSSPELGDAKPVPIAEALAALKKDYDHEGYRRFSRAIAMLEGFKDDPDTEVLLYRQ